VKKVKQKRTKNKNIPLVKIFKEELLRNKKDFSFRQILEKIFKFNLKICKNIDTLQKKKVQEAYHF